MQQIKENHERPLKMLQPARQQTEGFAFLLASRKMLPLEKTTTLMLTRWINSKITTKMMPSHHALNA